MFRCTGITEKRKFCCTVDPGSSERDNHKSYMYVLTKERQSKLNLSTKRRLNKTSIYVLV